MLGARIAGPEAWAKLMRSKAASWDENIQRFSEDVALVRHEPKFRLNAEETFFCMGSCFARNIEEHLILGGHKVLSKRVICPVEEWSHRPNGFVNKFTTLSMLNELEWTLHPPEVDESLFEDTKDGWKDLQLAPGIPPTTLERAIERRLYLLSDYFSRIRNASVVVLTLGLNEVWRDNRLGRYLNAPPTLYAARRDPERYALEISDFGANFDALERIHAALTEMSPWAKIIVTVSPVPMGKTFSGRDIAVANMLSKSVLRVAADAFAGRHDNVDYFPTYDMISMSPRAGAYYDDCMHVHDNVVAKMIAMFLELYLGEKVEMPDFHEDLYLEANPDVAQAIRRGELSSGYEHWVETGKGEGRLLAPLETAAATMAEPAPRRLSSWLRSLASASR
jgi:GSCFA family